MLAISLIAVALLFSAWIAATRRLIALRRDSPLLQQQRNILLVTAHPDDEAFFFTPTIVGIANKQPLSKFGLLCLSNGNAVGLGSIREKELQLVSKYLGIQDVYYTNDERLQDGWKAWNKEVISEKIAKIVETGGFDTVITFDELGISGHPNHRDVALGAAHFRLYQMKYKHKQPIKVFALTTVPLLRKYISALDAFFSSNTEGQIISVDSMRHAWEAMSYHASQFVWFRKASVLLSRYTWLNNLREVTVDGS